MKPSLRLDLIAIAEPSSNKKRGRRSFCLPKDSLSPRQAEVCLLLREGLMTKEIAGRLFITYNTADAHIRKVYEKLGVRSRAELFKHFETHPSIEVRAAPRDSDMVRILERLDAIDQQLLSLAQSVGANNSRGLSGDQWAELPEPVTSVGDLL